MFKKEVTWGQLLGIAITLITIVMGSYINTQVKLTKMDTEITRMKMDIENNGGRIDSNDDKVNAKLDKITEILTDIRVTVARTQNNTE